MSKGSADTRTPNHKKRREEYDKIDWRIGIDKGVGESWSPQVPPEEGCKHEWCWIPASLKRLWRTLRSVVVTTDHPS